MFGAPCSVFDVQLATFGVLSSAFGIRRSAFDIRFPILWRERLLGLSTSPIMAIYGDLPKLMHNALGRHCIPIDICVNPRYLCQHGKDRNIAELTIDIQGETNFDEFLRLLSCNSVFNFWPLHSFQCSANNHKEGKEALKGHYINILSWVGEKENTKAISLAASHLITLVLSLLNVC